MGLIMDVLKCVMRRTYFSGCLPSIGSCTGSCAREAVRAYSRVLGGQAERRFPNRLRARGWFSGNLATSEHVKPVWKPALRQRLANAPKPRAPQAESLTTGYLPHSLGPCERNRDRTLHTLRPRRRG